MAEATAKRPAKETPKEVSANENATNQEDQENERSAKVQLERLRQRVINEVIKPYQSMHLPTVLPKDILHERYYIDGKSPLPEFNTRHGKAYAVRDEEGEQSGLMAMVSILQLPPRMKLIKELVEQKIPHSTNIVDFGSFFSTISNREEFAIIYTRPMGRTLYDVIKAMRRKPSDSYLAQNVVAPLVEALSIIHTLGFSHGRINSKNIFFDKTITIGECCIEPCGYSQNFYYEAPERCQAEPAGRGEGVMALDFYALGILIAELKYEERIFANVKDPQTHVGRLLHEGSYQALVANEEMSEMMTDFLRGTLNDSRFERWGHPQLKSWVKGRKFNVLVPNIPAVAARAFTVNEKEYKNFRSLSHALFLNWEEAKEILRQPQITRWTELSARRKEMADGIAKNLRIAGEEIEKDELILNEFMTKSLCVLDPLAPIRMKEISSHMDGLGTLYADYVRNHESEKAETILRIVEQSIPEYWREWHVNFRNEELPTNLVNAMWQLDRMRISMYHEGYGFGAERIIYDLNPDLPCLSHLLEGRIANSTKSLLMILDSLAPTHAGKHSPLDMHISGYLASKLGQQGEIVVAELEHIPALARHEGLIALKLFQMAQEKAHDIPLPGLSSWLSLALLDAVKLYHSTTLRKVMQNGILQLSGNGNLEAMLNFLSKSEHSEADDKGYIDAVKAYAKMEKEIAENQSSYIIKYRATYKGAAAAKKFAYSILGITAFFLFNTMIF